MTSLPPFVLSSSDRQALLLVLVERNGMAESVRHASVLPSAQSERSRGRRYDNG